ncbi:MAG: transglycosylase SLT domain-containing protein [Streptomycetaceae bacterium]|nr:transglycosylase SLT domain-containing protein [Streptomycetaceae bacterium]
MRKLLGCAGLAALFLGALIIAGVIAVASALGSNNGGTDGNAGFGGGIADTAHVPDWLRPIIQDAVTRFGCPEVTPSLLAAQLYQESGFNPKITSPVGAQGIAQFMPGTWATSGKDGDGDGDTDVWDPADAVPSAVAYDCAVAAQVSSVPGDKVDNMLAGYNAGPGRVIEYQGIPPYEETRNYVKTIRELATKWAAAAAGGPPAAGGSPAAAIAIEKAKTALGSMYQWGGDCVPPFEHAGNKGCDCSSLMKYAWAAAGVNLPRTTYDQVHFGTPVARLEDIQPGDLIFSRGNADSPEHVAMYIGGNQFIEAPKSGFPVRIRPMSELAPAILVIRHVG